MEENKEKEIFEKEKIDGNTLNYETPEQKNVEINEKKEEKTNEESNDVKSEEKKEENNIVNAEDNNEEKALENEIKSEDNKQGQLREEPTNCDEKDKKKPEKENKKSHKVIIIIISIILGLLLICSVIFALLNVNNDKVIKGVTINGIDVSGYNKEELSNKLTEYIEKNQKKIIELKHNEQETDVTPEGIGTVYNKDEVVKQAYSLGRNGNIFINNIEILKALIVKRDFKLEGVPEDKMLTETIATLQGNLEGAVQEASYYIEGETLFITRGRDGIKIPEDKLKNIITKQINDFQKEVCMIDVPVENSSPKEIDIEKIHEEIYSEPQDAYISENPITVHPNVNGVDFAISIEEAKEIIKEEKEEYEIPLKITVANKTLAELGKEAFPNQLGTYTTKFYVGDSSRTNNIRLATQKINGIIVLPGETFSYNKTVGKRTIEAGFKAAGAYSGGKVVQEVGGGICQVSSTLYNAALYANLEIIERHNHCFESSYVAASRDATVSWGGPDFKFKNNRKYPIRIEASSSNGTEVVSIYGLQEEEEYEVIIQSRKLATIGRKIEYIDDDTLDVGEEIIAENGHDGCTSEAYRILKKNGEIVSSTLISRDTYIALARTIRRGTRTIYNEPEPREEVIETSVSTEPEPESEPKPEPETNSAIAENTEEP